MNFFITPEFWSLVSSFVSVILGLFAITLSIYFFVQGRKTEQNVTNSLTKIETQADALQKISGKQLDRLTKFVTEPKTEFATEAIQSLLPILSELPKNILNIQNNDSNQDNIEDLKTQLAVAYSALYFYTAQANFWSQFHLPSAEEFDPEVTIQNEAKSIVDLSSSDFNIVANAISRMEIDRIKNHTVEPLYQRTKDFWVNLVRDSAQVFITRGSEDK